MPRIKHEEIVGFFRSDGSLACQECMNEDDWTNLKPNDVLTEYDIERSDDLFFCDNCESEIN